MKKYRLFLVFLFLLLIINIFAQDFEVNYGIQADFTSILFVSTYSGSFDLEFIKIDEVNYAGIRIGYDRIYKYNMEGSVTGSPFTEIDFLGKLSLKGKLIEVNLCPGITYYKNTHQFFVEDKDGVSLKGVGEVKLKLFKNYAGLIFKPALSKEGYLGLGFYVGFNSRDFKKK